MLSGSNAAVNKRSREPLVPAEWAGRLIRTSLRRPLLVLLILCLFGSYLAFYGTGILKLIFVFAIFLMFSLICRFGKLVTSDLTSVMIGVVGFSVCYIGFSLWKKHEIRLNYSEYYIGNAKVISSNASDDGYKNIELMLDSRERVIMLTDQVLNYGDNIRLQATISPIVTKGNPGDMDVRSFYRKKGIIRSAERANIEATESSAWSPINFGYRIGSKIRRAFYGIWTQCTDEDTASVLSAMILGDDSHLSKEDKNTFRKSNLSHLLVVSGAHIGYFTATIGALCTLVLDEKRKIFGLTAFLILFGFVTGWAGSAPRSILMYLIVGYLSFFRHCIDRLSACSLSALILMCLDPFSVFSSGLLLSFGATFSIMIFHKKIENLLYKRIPAVPEEIRRAISCFVCAHIGMLPVLLSMGSKMSVQSSIVVVLSGFPAEMICSFGLVLTLISYLIPFNIVRSGLFVPVRGMVYVLKQMAYTGSKNYTKSLSLRNIPAFLLVFILCFVISFLIRPGLRRKTILILAFGSVFAFFIQNVFLPKKSSSVYFLDVGQGDCALITHNDISILVDGGNRGNGENIRKSMEYLGVSRIDMAFISHLDTDHISGILELWDMGLIDHLYAPFWSDSPEMNQLRSIFPDIPSEITILQKETVVTIDEDLSFHVIWPKDPKDGGNDDSMVMVCTLYAEKILFTGDISEEVEKVLEDPSLEHISVLKVSHHGSRFSTSDAFLNDKMIDAAVISVGYNHYGHPSGEVLKRLSDHDIPWLRTDERGCVLLSIDESGWDLNYYFSS